MSDDPRRSAWQYRLDRLARDEAIARGEDPDAADVAPEPAGPSTEAERSAYVENAIQQAIRRGEFDNLPANGRRMSAEMAKAPYATPAMSSVPAMGPVT